MYPILVAGMANADAHPHEVGAKMGVDGFQPIVARQPTAAFDPDLAGGKVDLVMQHDDVAGGNLVKTGSFAYRQPRFIHECMGFDRQHLFPVDPTFRCLAVEAFARGAEIVTVNDRIKRHEPDIVAVARIFDARITETNEKLHLSQRAGRPLLFAITVGVSGLFTLDAFFTFFVFILAAEAGGRGDGGDGKVAIGYRRCYAIGQFNR